MKTIAFRKSFIVLGTALALAVGSNAQTFWQNAADGHWTNAANWSVGVPGEDMHAVVTNATGSYTVTYDSTDAAFKNSTATDNTRLYIGNADEEETVTLNVRANMTRDATPTTDDFRLYMTEGAVINVTNATLTANAGADLKGTLNILDGGTVRLRTVTSNSGMSPLINVQDGGLLQLYPANNFSIGRSAVITIEEGGLMRHTDGQRDMLFTSTGSGSGGRLVVRGEYRGDTRIRLGFQASYAWPEIRVEGDGVFTQEGTGRRIDLVYGDANHNSGRFTLHDNAVVTNRAPLNIGQSNRILNPARHCRGELLIYGGSWFNNSTTDMQVGGPDLAADVDFSALDATWYNDVRGTLLVQTGGVFRTLANTIYLANGPSTGLIHVEGGDFIATNATGTATMHVASQFFVQASVPPPGSGTVHIASGSLTVDRLVAVHEGFSRIDFEAGTLSASEIVVTNGLPLVVGDGIQAATLELRGGTHSFDDGLRLSANGTLRIGATNTIQSATINGDLVLETGSRLAWTFEEGDQDSLTVSGEVTLPAVATVEVFALDGSTPASIPLITADGFSGTPAGWPSVTIQGAEYQPVLDGNTLALQVPRGTLILLR